MEKANGRNEAFRYLSPSARLVLGLAFAALLALLATAGWNAWSTLGELHAREEAVRLDFLSRAEPMIQVRSKMVVYGDMVQDSVLPDRVSPEKVSHVVSEIQQDLDRYPQSRRPEEEALLANLRVLLQQQERVRSEMIALHNVQRMQAMLGSKVLPSHLRAVAATEQIALWNDNRLRASNAELLLGFKEVRGNLKRLLTILLCAAFAIALGSILLLTVQERELRQRYVELARNQEVQEQLSARLLDAQEQERRAISRELHDEVGQQLGALLVDAGRLSTILPVSDGPAQDAIRKIRSSAETSVASIRNIALLLRPSMLDDLGLVAAIEWQAREISRRSAVEVEVDAENVSAELKEDVKICLYRLTQEALNNVAKHSEARHAWVVLKESAERIALTIRDDGKGFDPQRSRGLGLLGMQERLRLVHGSLNVRSTPGEGTTLSAEIPLA